MALDMEQLRKMFYEECRENLEEFESVLLELDPNDVDTETINTIFRAAHSIKGGAATFNLFDISEFTHSVEAYLDLVRNGELSLTQQSIDVMLQSGDCISNLLEGHESGKEVDASLQESVGYKLKALLNELTEVNSEVVSEPPEGEAAENELSSSFHWLVNFKPHAEMFFSGNDPLRILRELVELDDNHRIEANVDNLPDIQEIESELSYLSWAVEVSGEIPEDEIREIFEWVEDECDLTLEKMSQLASTESETATNDIQAESSVESAEHEFVDTDSTSNTPDAVPEAADSQVINASKDATKKPPATPAKANKTESSVSSIRVDIDKVDSLINLVGELVITQSMLTEIGNDFTIDKLEKLKSGLDQLLQNSKDLQENVLNIRMLPMSFAFSRFPRLVRDLCGRLDKKVELLIKGEQTELDKTVLERIVDPLVHLVRNGIDHGIEVPQVRLESGKPEQGTIELNAYHQGGAIVIEIIDDGAGIDCDKLWAKAQEKGVVDSNTHREEMSDKQVLNLIFAPGFSTAEQVSDISGAALVWMW
ncbi:chemotaxis protein CheA [Vibrio mexicanus]|uniref:chemotaxis protein CheA n=1 Tax=Vibrio mexicanus TaxID=1004326 RepID=UPI000A885A57